MSEMELTTLRVMDDNYIHVMIHAGRAAAIDPGVAAPLLALLAERGLLLEAVLLTHGHHDHTGGVAALVEDCGCEVYGPAGVAVHGLRDGERLDVCGTELEVLATPGHSDCDLCYYSRDDELLFTGDTLFLCGCGRVFGGDYARMWASLQRLAALPPATRIYCGHDYTSENIAFALGVESSNRRLLERGRSATAEHGTIAEELATNPFLRPQSGEIRRRLGMESASDAELFERLRRMKNSA
jgi:hydroxyacylglutathione hydrolase